MTRAKFQGRSRLIRSGILTCFLLASSLVFATASTAAGNGKSPRAKKPEAVPGEYVIKLKKPVGDLSPAALSGLIGAPVVQQLREDVLLIRSTAQISSAKLMSRLKANANVERVEPNYIYRIVKVPNDPGLSGLWGLKNSGSLDKEGTRGLPNVDIGAERAWDLTTGSRSVVVAVIDTGVDYTHEDLAANAWVNDKELHGKADFDDDMNGFVDDIHGYDFANDDGNPMDDNAHGTHCSGTIGASGDDGKGLVGVNWNVSIMGVKFLDDSGSGTLANAILSIDYATQMRVDIMSNSWGGGGYSETLEEAIKRARKRGILFIAAAGNSAANNDDAPEYPASYTVDNVLSVAAVDNRGDLAYFSNYGATSVHIAAPGHNILSTVPGNDTDIYSGTSMATPHVSGVAALLLAHNRKLGYDEIKERLMRTSKPLATLKGRVAAGMVDAYHALTDTKAPADANDPSVWTLTRNEPVSTAHPYQDNHTQTWTIRSPGAKRIAVHFSKFETESGYDKVQFLTGAGESIGTWSGTRNDRFSPIADGDTIVLKFTSDSSASLHGFDIDYIIQE